MCIGASIDFDEFIIFATFEGFAIACVGCPFAFVVDTSLFRAIAFLFIGTSLFVAPLVVFAFAERFAVATVFISFACIWRTSRCRSVARRVLSARTDRFIFVIDAFFKDVTIAFKDVITRALVIVAFSRRFVTRLIGFTIINLLVFMLWIALFKRVIKAFVSVARAFVRFTRRRCAALYTRTWGWLCRAVCRRFLASGTDDEGIAFASRTFGACRWSGGNACCRIVFFFACLLWRHCPAFVALCPLSILTYHDRFFSGTTFLCAFCAFWCFARFAIIIANHVSRGAVCFIGPFVVLAYLKFIARAFLCAIRTCLRFALGAFAAFNADFVLAACLRRSELIIVAGLDFPSVASHVARRADDVDAGIILAHLVVALRFDSPCIVLANFDGVVFATLCAFFTCAFDASAGATNLRVGVACLFDPSVILANAFCAVVFAIDAAVFADELFARRIVAAHDAFIVATILANERTIATLDADIAIACVFCRGVACRRFDAFRPQAGFARVAFFFLDKGAALAYDDCRQIIVALFVTIGAELGIGIAFARLGITNFCACYTRIDVNPMIVAAFINGELFAFERAIVAFFLRRGIGVLSRIGIGLGIARFGRFVASLVVVARFNGFPFFVAAFSDGGVTYALTYAIWIALIGGWGLFRAVWHATPLCFIARLCCTTRRLVLPLAVDAFIERIDDAFIRAIGTRAVVGSFATRCRGSGRYADKEQSQMMSLHNITPMLRNYLKNQTNPKWLISTAKAISYEFAFWVRPYIRFARQFRTKLRTFCPKNSAFFAHQS